MGNGTKSHVGTKTGKAARKMEDLDDLGMERLTDMISNPYKPSNVLGWLQVIHKNPYESGDKFD